MMMMKLLLVVVISFCLCQPLLGQSTFPIFNFEDPAGTYDDKVNVSPGPWSTSSIDISSADKPNVNFMLGSNGLIVPTDTDYTASSVYFIRFTRPTEVDVTSLVGGNDPIGVNIRMDDLNQVRGVAIDLLSNSGTSRIHSAAPIPLSVGNNFIRFADLESFNGPFGWDSVTSMSFNIVPISGAWSFTVRRIDFEIPEYEPAEPLPEPTIDAVSGFTYTGKFNRVTQLNKNGKGYNTFIAFHCAWDPVVVEDHTVSYYEAEVSGKRLIGDSFTFVKKQRLGTAPRGKLLVDTRFATFVDVKVRAIVEPDVDYLLPRYVGDYSSTVNIENFDMSHMEVLRLERLPDGKTLVKVELTPSGVSGASAYTGDQERYEIQVRTFSNPRRHPDKYWQFNIDDVPVTPTDFSVPANRNISFRAVRRRKGRHVGYALARARTHYVGGGTSAWTPWARKDRQIRLT